MQSLLFVILMYFCVTFAHADSNIQKANNKADKKEEHLYTLEYFKIHQNDIKNLKYYFSCGGIGILDQGSAMDGATFYFKEPSKDILAMCAIGACVASDSRYVECNLICPPPEWVVNKCSEKFLTYRRKTFR